MSQVGIRLPRLGKISSALKSEYLSTKYSSMEDIKFAHICEKKAVFTEKRADSLWRLGYSVDPQRESWCSSWLYLEIGSLNLGCPRSLQ